MKRSDLVLGTLRERGTIVIVGALCGMYATVLLLCSNWISLLGQGNQSAMGTFLRTMSAIFIGIALYVAAVVISGCVATVIAGREQYIAMLRLLGAGARSLRKSVSLGCLYATGIGALVGVVLGHVVALMGRTYLIHHHTLPNRAYPNTDWHVLFAVLAVLVCGWWAGRLGSRRVLTVSPTAALGGQSENQITAARRSRAVLASVLLPFGALMMAMACYLGEKGSSAGFLGAFFGCLIFGTGMLIGGPFIIPLCVKVISQLIGRGVPAQIARRNTVVDPIRTSRSVLGIILGTGLITTILSGIDAVRLALPTWHLSRDHLRIAREFLNVMSTLMTCIIAISSVIAAVGFISTMSLTVIQRRHEIGLLRALGLTRGEITRMITIEALALGVTAVTLGMGLGILFGSVAAQSLIGRFTQGIIVGIPIEAMVVLTLAALALVMAAALPPARRANKVTPVEALRMT